MLTFGINFYNILPVLAGVLLKDPTHLRKVLCFPRVRGGNPLVILAFLCYTKT